MKESKVITIDGIKVDLPESWNDLSVDQMQQALKTQEEDPELWKDILFRISVYSGIPYEQLQNRRINDESFEQLIDLLKWERSPLDINKILSEIPNTIKFFDKDGKVKETIRVPKKIEEERLGSKILFMQEVAKVMKGKAESEMISIVPLIHKALAIYFQPMVHPGPKKDEPFNTDYVTDFEEVCKRCKFVDALPVAAFFLMKSLNWMNGKRRK